MSSKQFGTGSGSPPLRRVTAAAASVMLVASVALAGAPAASGIGHPSVDGVAPPPDGPPGPPQPMRQTSYCTEVGVLPGTDFRVRPKFLDMLDLPAAWQFGRGAGVK